MTLFTLPLFLMLAFLPPDVKEALDKLTFFENVRIEFIRHFNAHGLLPHARTFYMRNEQGQEMVISEASFKDDGRKLAKRALMKDGLTAISMGTAPAFQVISSDANGVVAGISPELMRGAASLTGDGHVPTLQSFHLRGKLKKENVQRVTVEEDGDKQIYHILTNLRHQQSQEGSSTLSFVYDQVTGRIVETWIHPGERCRIDYGDRGEIKRLTTVYDGYPGQNMSLGRGIPEYRNCPARLRLALDRVCARGAGDCFHAGTPHLRVHGALDRRRYCHPAGVS